jgi:hypothetical protein
MKRRIALLAVLVIVSSPVLAEGIPVEPGQWEITTTMTMPMLPAPQTMTVEECFKDEIMDMDDMATDDLDPNCVFDLGQVDDTSMQWTIDCPVEGGTMHAEWVATSGGDTVEGEGKMTMSVAGQTMDMQMNWTGKRVGECN